MYSNNLATEGQGTEIICAFLNAKGRRTQRITDPAEQKSLGDLRVYSPKGNTNLELKIENRWTGNLFVEEYSNLEWGTAGWLFTCKADYICFYFLDTDLLYALPFNQLKRFMLEQPYSRLKRYPSKMAKSSGKNDTWGVIVPIAHVRDLQGYWESSPLRILNQNGQENYLL